MDRVGVLGGGLDDDFLPDVEELSDDEELDAFNDETFGGELPEDEWELDVLSEQTAELDGGATLPVAVKGAIRTENVWFDQEAMLEASISHLIDDDDDQFPRLPAAPGLSMGPIVTPETKEDSHGRGRPIPGSGGSRLDDLFGTGSPQSPFYNTVLATKSDIWGPPPDLTKPSSPPAAEARVRGDSSEQGATTVIMGNRRTDKYAAYHGRVSEPTTFTRHEGRHEGSQQTLRQLKNGSTSATNTIIATTAQAQSYHQQPGPHLPQQTPSRVAGIQFGSIPPGFLDNKPTPQQPSQQAQQQKPLIDIISQMQMSEEKKTKEVKGAKTLAELEAELLKPKAPHKHKVMSLAELERQLRNRRSPPATAGRQPAQGPGIPTTAVPIPQTSPTDPTTTQFLLSGTGSHVTPTPANRLPPGVVNAQSGGAGGFPLGYPTNRPFAHPPPAIPIRAPTHTSQTQVTGSPKSTGGAFPPPPHMALPPPGPWMMNPQARAALLHHVASGKPLPPGFPHPSVLFRTPGPGGVRMPPNMSGVSGGRMSDPSHLQQMRMQGHPLVHHPNFNPQQMAAAAAAGKFPAARRGLFNDPQSGGQLAYMRQQMRDPHAGLMSRREREWLVKIHMLQTQSENSYQDDYYFLMYRSKEFAKERKNSGKEDPGEGFFLTQDSIDTGHTPYNYVPPKFEGSLGKVQFVSANFPRQLIDIASDTPSSSSPNSSTPHTPPPHENGVKKAMIPSVNSLKGRKQLLMEIENLWNFLLDCEERTHQLGVAPEDVKQKILLDMKERTGVLWSRVWGETGERLEALMGVRKGRGLVGRGLGLLGKEEVLHILTNFATHLSLYAKKDYSNDFPFAFLLLLLCHCSRKNVVAESELRNTVLNWSSFVITATNPPPDWLTPPMLHVLLTWLNTNCALNADVIHKLQRKLTKPLMSTKKASYS